MAIRDLMKESLANATRDVKPIGKAVLGAIGTRDVSDLLIREDCPCPAADCPHKGNCVTCINYHHMMSTALEIRMVIPACTYFSERDYWIAKRKSTNSSQVKEAIDEWLAYYRDVHNLRTDMTKDKDFMDWGRLFEDKVIEKWAEVYLDENGKPKPAKEREKRIAKNKRMAKNVPGAYPYK